MTCCQQRVFLTSLLKPLKGIQRNFIGSKISTSSTNFEFIRPIRKTRWTPRHLIGWNIFQLLFRNRWTKFKLTWQVARSQRPTILCISGGLKKARWPPRLWLAKTFSTFPLKPLNGIQWNLRESKIPTSSSKIVFFGPFSKQKWSSWRIRQKGGIWYSGAQYVALWASCFMYSHITSVLSSCLNNEEVCWLSAKHDYDKTHCLIYRVLKLYFTAQV